MNDPNKKKKTSPIKAYLAANPSQAWAKPMLKGLRGYGLSQNKIVQIASQMFTKPEHRIYKK